VALAVEWPACSLDDYGLLLASLELSPGGRALPTCLFHWAERTPTGILVHEVWSDRALCELVLIDFVLPAATLLGLPTPKIELRTVENFLTGTPSGDEDRAPPRLGRAWDRPDRG
jgi:hypothetical protein